MGHSICGGLEYYIKQLKKFLKYGGGQVISGHLVLFMLCKAGRLHDGHLVGEGQLKGAAQVGHCGGGLSNQSIKIKLSI